MMQDRSSTAAVSSAFSSGSSSSGSSGGGVNIDNHGGDYATTATGTMGISSRRTYDKSSSSSLRKKRHQGDASTSITSTTPFLVLVTLLALAMTIQFMIVINWHHKRHDEHVLGKQNDDNPILPIMLSKSIGSSSSRAGRFDMKSASAENDDNVQEEQPVMKKSNSVGSLGAQVFHRQQQPKVSTKKTISIYHRNNADSSLAKPKVTSLLAKTTSRRHDTVKHTVKKPTSKHALSKEKKASLRDNKYHRHFQQDKLSEWDSNNPAKMEDAEDIRPEWIDNRFGADTAAKDGDDALAEHEDFGEEDEDKEDGAEVDDTLEQANKDNKDPTMAHLVPYLPPLPPILNTRKIKNQKDLISDTLSGKHPTIAGIALVLARFLNALHNSNNKLASLGSPPSRDEVHERFVKLAKKYLAPFETTYRDKPIFPIRDDDSIFVSLASFRDYLLGDTLKGAFDQAKYPDKLFIGAIVQNCLGLDPYEGEPGVQCRTGAQVVGRDKHGRDFTKVSDAPPDRNGIEEFCTSEEHKKYCDNGQVRVLYLHEAESLGPAMARYYASKLWGGERYFMQVDAHLEFYKHWDELYTNELKSASSFPTAVLSSYPPGFQAENGGILEGQPSLGTRLCSCTFSDSDVESQIIRINTGVGYVGDEDHPTQIPFIAAGFFFTTAEFLADVPFDPYMPWCFMGEEIMLSMRAWTHGWDIYAPRHNWIAHQYRPGRMGLPKFWGSVGRLFGKPGPGFSNQLQLRVSA